MPQARAAAARATSVSYFFDIDDEFVFNARLPPGDRGSRSQGAPDGRRSAGALRTPDDVSAETPLQIAANARRADALRHIAEMFLEHGEETGADRARIAFKSSCTSTKRCSRSNSRGDDEPHRCELEDGPALALDTARGSPATRRVVGIVEGEDGEPLDIGRKTRSIPAAIARALKARDGGCRFPGAIARASARATTSSTGRRRGNEARNLITLCGFHHRLVHEGGYGLRRTDEAYSSSRGRTAGASKRMARNVSAETFCRPSASSSGFENSLRDYLMRHEPGLSITAETSRCQWRGETMDYSQAIEAMQVLSAKRQPRRRCRRVTRRSCS